MTVARPEEASAPEVGGLADDLARASLALARRFAAGATMWCCSPEWPSHAYHVSVEFVHPVIMGKRALPAVTVPPGQDVVEWLRASVRPGDIVVAIAPASDGAVSDAMRRAAAWGAETVWIGGGPRPAAGAADHVLWLDTDDPLVASEQFVRVYHLLWELTHVCFEHTGLLKPEVCEGDVCITCSDEGRLAEVVSVEGDEAVVRTPDGTERIDVSLIDPPRFGDLVLVHAGSAIGTVDEPGAAS
ncbi:MAG TPA: HypC/HybG/HupF family hydrogenase formation chaperone [Acidimicrobiales bacterium]|nr:HypC/HybG/HupF family hydrogenase formation chaperone [Acidimicrobiales bacterium]